MTKIKLNDGADVFQRIPLADGDKVTSVVPGLKGQAYVVFTAQGYIFSVWYEEERDIYFIYSEDMVVGPAV